MFDNKRHALLTGPNKGGKSTVLRSVLISVFLAHVYGCSLGSYSKMTPFYSMFACLKPDDLPGSKSRFEREIEFTSNTIKKAKEYKEKFFLILIDELYHSTNPPDALYSCKEYCNLLWNTNNCISVISTHLFDLVSESDETRVIKLCCPAKINSKTGITEFTHKLCKGICKISSVKDLLRENNLLE